jgi:hypothetical protein
MSKNLIILTIMACATVVYASDSPEQLIKQWLDANGTCRGSSGSVSDRACTQREELGAKLEPMGWCYGRKGESGAQHKWHLCGSASEHQHSAAAPSEVLTSGVVSVLCTGRTVFFYELGGRDQKTWTDEALVFDFDKKMVRHAEEDDGPPILQETPTSIHWKDESEYRTEGNFSRVSLSGKETLHLGRNTIVNYYDTCRLAKPRF